MKEFIDEICTKLEETRADLRNLATIRKIINSNHENFQGHVVTCTQLHSSNEERNDDLITKFDENKSEIREIRVGQRDQERKLSLLQETLTQLQKSQTESSITASKKFAKELRTRDTDIVNCNQKIRAMESIINGQRTHMDNLSTQVMRFQVHVEHQDQRLESLKDTEITNLHHRIEDIMKEATKQTNWYSETNMKLDKSLLRLEPLHERMFNLESFV